MELLEELSQKFPILEVWRSAPTSPTQFYPKQRRVAKDFLGAVYVHLRHSIFFELSAYSYILILPRLNVINSTYLQWLRQHLKLSYFFWQWWFFPLPEQNQTGDILEIEFSQSLWLRVTKNLFYHIELELFITQL